MFVTGWVVDAGGLGMDSYTTAEEARGENARIVENDEFIAAQEVGKFAELPVFPRAGGFVDEQHAGSVARGERVLRDALRRQVEI
jgi:hypothetical protein